MIAEEIFNLTPRDWTEVNDICAAAEKREIENVLTEILNLPWMKSPKRGTPNIRAQKALVLGIMLGRASR